MPVTTRWPDSRQAAVSITMDNMGEAAEIFRGSWPEDREIGRHPAVTRDLPRMLQLLEEFGVTATYFIEAWNTGVYGDEIRDVRDRGHEIAFHGWQHEPWSQLDFGTERHLFEKCMSAFAESSLRVEGFRPPGGMLTEQTPQLLREYGMRYCSPAGSNAALCGDISYLPFEWQGIDAYYYSDAFAGLREKKGDHTMVMDPGQFVERFRALLQEKVERGGYTALLFHPFLENDADRISAMEEIIASVMDDDRIWCAPCGAIANWIAEYPATFSDDPDLDLTTWSR